MTSFFDTRPRDVTLTTDGSAKDAGDVVGGLITIPVTTNGQFTTGVLRSVCIVDDDEQDAALTIYLFDSEPAGTAIADDAAFTLSATDAAKLIGKVVLASADYETIGGLSWQRVSGTDVDIEFATANGNLYAYVVCTATPTYSAIGPTLRFSIQRD